MGLFDEPDRLRARKGCDERLPALRLASPAYVKDTRTKAPQAILKVTSFARGARVKQLMEYVARANQKDDHEFEDEGGQLNRGKAEVKKIYDRWRQDFECKKPGAKRDPRHATHIVLHAKVPNDADNAYRVNTAARDFLQKEFGDQGYEYIFATHRDGKHPHVHVVIKNYNLHQGKKLRLNRRELLELRRSFARELQIQGIEHVATLKMDRPLLERELRGHLTALRRSEPWYLRKLKQAPGGEKYLSERMTLGAGIALVKQAVRQTTKPRSPERLEAMRELVGLSDKLKSQMPDDFRRNARGLVERLKRELPALGERLPSWQQIEAKAGQLRRSRPLTHTQRLNQRRQSERFAERYSKGVIAAIAEIRKNPQISAADRQQMLMALNDQARRFRGIGLGRER